MQETRELTYLDRKVLKREKRIGYVFGLLIVCFGGLFNLFCYISDLYNSDFVMITLANFGILMIAIFVCSRINRSVRRDLTDNVKELLHRTVVKKTEQKTYEAGSGALHAPILGDLFPQLYSQKMRMLMKYTIHTDDGKFEVSKDQYRSMKKGSVISVHIARHSRTVLGLSEQESELVVDGFDRN